MRKIAFFDFDNTIYNGYTYQKFINFVSDEVIKTDKFQNKVEEKLKNIKDYNELVSGITDILCEMMEGWTKDDFEKYCKISCHRNNIFSWVAPVISFLKSTGFETVIISASFNEMVADSLNVLDIDRVYCSSFQLEEGKYNGKIKLLLNDVEKSKIVKSEISGKDTFSIAFGDSIGDVPMLDSVDLAFLVRSCSVGGIEVENIAKEKGWFLGANHERIIEVIKDKI